MKNKKKTNNKFMLVVALIAILIATIISGCGATENSTGEAGEAGHAETSSEGGMGGGEASEAGHAETGGEGEEGGEGGGANALMPNQTFDLTQNGARLILAYDASNNTFAGTIENTTSSTLTRVRVEIHLSNGTELGPTTPTDLASGEFLQITLPATSQPFDTWNPHAEVGAGEGDEAVASEGGEGGSEGNNESAGGEASGESGDPSSPVLALNESWDGVVDGIRVAMTYDQATQIFSGIVENTTEQPICYVQIELNLKQGTTTIVELGPGLVGTLAPGEQAQIQLLVADEPEAAGILFDAWEIHPESFDCSGSGPVPHTSGEGTGESGGESGHSEGGEGGGG